MWVLFISVKGIPATWYNSTVAPLKCKESAPSTPLVNEDTVVPDIVPDTTSATWGSPFVSLGLVIFKWTVPLPGNPVELVRVNDVAAAFSCADNVVDIPDVAPLIVTLLLVVCIAWSGWNILTVVEVLRVSIALFLNVWVGTGSFSNSILPDDVVVNFARYKLNFISWNWKPVYVESFCDLNNAPKNGWSFTNLLPPTSSSPIWEIHCK